MLRNRPSMTKHNTKNQQTTNLCQGLRTTWAKRLAVTVQKPPSNMRLESHADITRMREGSVSPLEFELNMQSTRVPCRLEVPGSGVLNSYPIHPRSARRVRAPRACSPSSEDFTLLTGRPPSNRTERILSPACCHASSGIPLGRTLRFRYLRRGPSG